MTTLLFIRHGQSTANLSKRFTGQGDIPLTDLGRLQAENTARYLAQYPVTAIYSSDLIRSMETALPTAKYFGLEIIPMPELREVDAGNWTMREYTDLQANDSEAFELWLHKLGFAHPTGGESVREMADRIQKALEKIVTRHPNATVAVFSHATPMRVMGCLWQGIPIEQAGEIPWGGNASVSVVEYDTPTSAHLLKYGFSEHQGNLSTNLKGV